MSKHSKNKKHNKSKVIQNNKNNLSKTSQKISVQHHTQLSNTCHISDNDEYINTLYNQLLNSNITFPELDYQYHDYIQFLLQKYGSVSDDYMIMADNGSYHKNPHLSYPHEDLVIHHIREDQIADLSKIDIGSLFPEFQTKDQLVYANDLEHGILHYIINRDNQHHLGIGGIINYGLMSSYANTNDFTKKQYLFMLCKLYMSNQESVYKNQLIRLIQNVQNNQASYLGLEIQKRMNLYHKDDIHTYILTHYNIGIHERPISEYFELTQAKFIRQYNNVYFLRSPHDITAVVVYNTRHQVILFNNKQRITTPWYDIAELYSHLDEYYNLMSHFTNLLSERMQPILKQLILTYKRSDFFIHGCIIDIDSFNHIFYNPTTNQLIGYYSNPCLWNLGHRIRFISASNLLLDNNTTNTLLPTLTQHYIMPQFTQEQLIPMCNKLRPKNVENIYEYNTKIYSIQQTIGLKHLCEWQSAYDALYNWQQTQLQLTDLIIDTTIDESSTN